MDDFIEEATEYGCQEFIKHFTLVVFSGVWTVMFYKTTQTKLNKEEEAIKAKKAVTNQGTTEREKLNEKLEVKFEENVEEEVEEADEKKPEGEKASDDKSVAQELKKVTKPIVQLSELKKDLKSLRESIKKNEKKIKNLKLAAPIPPPETEAKEVKKEPDQSNPSNDETAMEI